MVFAFHGFPGAVHQLVHGRPDADRFHVRGFIEQGTTTTPFDMTVRNRASRYHLVMDAINNAKRHPAGAAELKAWCQAQLAGTTATSWSTWRTCPRSATGPGSGAGDGRPDHDVTWCAEAFGSLSATSARPVRSRTIGRVGWNSPDGPRSSR